MSEKKHYDFDYNTQFKKEYYYLKEHGIRPMTSIKNDEGVITFKYRRSSKLFKAVAAFYENYENEKMYETLSKITEVIKNGAEHEDQAYEGIMSLNPQFVNSLFRQIKTNVNSREQVKKIETGTEAN